MTPLFELFEELSKIYENVEREEKKETCGCGCKSQLKCESLVETDKCSVYKAVLPGLKKENIQIEVSDGILRISLIGLKSDTEFVPKSYTREIVLGEHSGDNIEAKYDEGILTIVIPKVVEKKPKTINIKIN